MFEPWSRVRLTVRERSELAQSRILAKPKPEGLRGNKVTPQSHPSSNDRSASSFGTVPPDTPHFRNHPQLILGACCSRRPFGVIIWNCPSFVMPSLRGIQERTALDSYPKGITQLRKQVSKFRLSASHSGWRRGLRGGAPRRRGDGRRGRIGKEIPASAGMTMKEHQGDIK